MLKIILTIIYLILLCANIYSLYLIFNYKKNKIEIEKLIILFSSINMIIAIVNLIYFIIY